MSYVIPPRRAVQALDHLMTDEEKQILEKVRERERQQKAEHAEVLRRHLEQQEARRDAQSAADRDARAKPTQVLARQIASAFAHLDLHRLIHDLARTDRGQLVAELQEIWRRDEGQWHAGSLTKPLTAGQTVLARHGLLEE